MFARSAPPAMSHLPSLISPNGVALTPPSKARVIVVDAHACVRELVEMALRLEGNCEVVGRAGHAASLLHLCTLERPEILVLDPKLPDISGGEIVRRLRQQHREMKIVVLSGTMSREVTLDVLDARPHGFVHKEEPLSIFYEVLRAVMRGSQCFSEYGARLMEQPTESGGARVVLTRREKDVLGFLAHGLSSKQIAHELNLATKTIDHYRMALMSKLNIHEVAGLTRYAVSTGLVNVER